MKKLLHVNILKVRKDLYKVYDKKNNILGEMIFVPEREDWLWKQGFDIVVTAEILGEIQNALLYLYTVENLK
jgi:hypothetical protein